ncbi:DNA repair protein RecN [Sulfuricystis thermophila]|uniref:DNA repair protein RecN n=1 Tax=Sulfuricystis thermophila TaxID=2496847 RepID=UPI001035967B|nr:DNA repair protein RecN [Sulfuricystis thermophila]
MLLSLTIRDFVIVDRLDLEFEPGFGALTGETGAGKSILVDALSLALGERADATVVRSGALRADIAAEFSLTPDAPLADWLAANDFATDTCLLRRVVEATGRSRAWINGTAATLAQLREVAEFLCDIHGQHAHHSLLRPEAQRALLDAYAGVEALARNVAARHADWRKLSSARAAAERDVAASARERELLEWQVKELAALGFEASDWQETEAEQRRLSHAASLLEASSAALAALEEGELPVLPLLQQASGRLTELTAVDANLGEAAQLFESALIQLDEAALALRRYRERLDLDPARLAELDARIDAVTQLARKHRVTPEELPAVQARLEARLAELQLAADPALLAEREREAQAAYLAVARQLSEARRQAAEKLSAAVTQAMQELAMPGGRFAIELATLPEGGAHGLETVEFLVSANAGQPLRPLAKVASGGELSRIGLSLQVIASQSHAVDTLIFDEVDVGIGGRVAEIVGRMLRQLGSDRQVLCVTHLPQVAACAHWQWSIRKETREGRTVSRVTPLDDAGRVEEIARMLGGVNITETTRKHAREMLGL